MLGEFEILAIVVHLPVLMLAEPVKPLVGAAIELDPRFEPLLAFDLDRIDPAGGSVFVEQNLAAAIVYG